MKLKALDSIWQAARVKSPYLMIALHDRGDSMHGLYDLSARLDLPNLNYLFLNAPHPVQNDGGKLGYSWSELPRDRDSAETLRSSAAALETVISELVSEGYQRQDLFFFGFAQGMRIMQEHCLRSDHAYRGCIGISGIPSLEDFRADFPAVSPRAREIRWLITHGSIDDAVPPEKAREQVHAMRDRGLNVYYVEYLKGRCIEPVGEIPIIRKWVQRLLK